MGERLILPPFHSSEGEGGRGRKTNLAPSPLLSGGEGGRGRKTNLAPSLEERGEEGEKLILPNFPFSLEDGGGEGERLILPRQTDMFIWSLIQEIVRRPQFPS